MEFLEYLGTDWQIQIFAERGLIILRANRGKEVKYFTLKGDFENKNNIDSFTYLNKEQRKNLPVPEDYKKATFEQLQKVREWYRDVSFEVFPYQNRLEIYAEFLRKQLEKKKGKK